jgi:hypothetical protein
MQLFSQLEHVGQFCDAPLGFDRINPVHRGIHPQ